MAKAKLVTWAIPNFPEKVKNKFIGMAKIQGKSMRELLANLIRGWLYEQEERKDDKDKIRENAG